MSSTNPPTPPTQNLAQHLRQAELYFQNRFQGTNLAKHTLQRKYDFQKTLRIPALYPSVQSQIGRLKLSDPQLDKNHTLMYNKVYFKE
jgi:hypothetical protein